MIEFNNNDLTKIFNEWLMANIDQKWWLDNWPTKLKVHHIKCDRDSGGKVKWIRVYFSDAKGRISSVSVDNLKKPKS